MQFKPQSGEAGPDIVETIVVEARQALSDNTRPPGQRSGHGADSVLDLMLKDAAARSPAQDLDSPQK